MAGFADSIDSIEAIGLSGSHARRNADILSDIDICVYIRGELPSPQIRQRGYTQLGALNPIYFDVDFEYSRGDGFLINGVRCDFNWMSISTVRSFLQRLDTDYDCPEYIPGGLAMVKQLYDPNAIIRDLQEVIPPYSDARAQHRIEGAIHNAYVALYDFGWLEKAAFRKDDFLFLKYSYNLLELLFRALFALNHVWLCDEKWLTRRIANFEYVPKHIEMRIHSIVMHHHENSELSNCLASLKRLFAESVQSIHGKYPHLDMPMTWG